MSRCSRYLGRGHLACDLFGNPGAPSPGCVPLMGQPNESLNPTAEEGLFIMVS
jgi:hypothetical protein